MRRLLPFATPHGPSWPGLKMPELRMEEYMGDPPFASPPYSSLFKDVLLQNHLFKRDALIRENALFPLRLKAGQSTPKNGQLGQNFKPKYVPELAGGLIYYAKT